jgi:hypothetical protein|tara:strand:+ start:200 stop:517 length:318 start_codon:yes stop_codon:yes gene_type:complete
MINKVERDGRIAVLVSPGFGAGWSTWSDDEQRDLALFDPRLVAAAEANVSDIDDLVKEVFGDVNFYTGGWHQVEVRWVNKGDSFSIEEYDGSESMRSISDLTITA